MVGRIASSSPVSAAKTSFPSLSGSRPAWDGRFTVLILFLPPALLLFSLFVVLPIGEAAWYSGFNWNGFGRPTNWIGFDNYRFVLQTRAFWLALLVALPLIVAARPVPARAPARRNRQARRKRQD